jgi:hypothetical protein
LAKLPEVVAQLRISRASSRNSESALTSISHEQYIIVNRFTSPEPRETLQRPSPIMSSANAIDALVQALGDDLVATGPGIPDRRYGDWSGVPYSVPLALLRPRNTEQLARMLQICHEFGQPVVPQGGLTGLAGGAAAAPPRLRRASSG